MQAPARIYAVSPDESNCSSGEAERYPLRPWCHEGGRHKGGALNARLTIQGIVLTMFDPRNNLSAQVVADVRSFMGDKVYETMIPRNVRVSEAPSHGKPVLLYDLKCAGSQAYLRLASEIIQREGRLPAAA